MLDWLIDNVFAIVGVAGIGGLLGIVLKKYVTEKAIKNIKAKVEGFGFWVGKVSTVNLSGWKITKGIWNSVIEPYVILILDAIFNGFLAGIIKGLESDKESLKK